MTVSRTIQRLQEAGLVRSEPYRSVFLTDAGREMARRSRERHQAVLAFLLALGVPQEVALADAEGIEHHVSDTTLDRMRRFAAASGVSSTTTMFASASMSRSTSALRSS